MIHSLAEQMINRMTQSLLTTGHRVRTASPSKASRRDAESHGLHGCGCTSGKGGRAGRKVQSNGRHDGGTEDGRILQVNGLIYHTINDDSVGLTKDNELHCDQMTVSPSRECGACCGRRERQKVPVCLAERMSKAFDKWL